MNRDSDILLVLAHVAGIPLNTVGGHDHITTSMPNKVIEAARRVMDSGSDPLTSIDDLAQHLGYGDLNND